MSERARVLVVDDEPAQVLALVRTLSHEGYGPTGANGAEEALQHLRSARYDILVTDLLMPGMNGVELLRAAQAMDADLVAIVMTGHGTIDTAVQAMKGGALDYILKPFNLSTIVPVLERATTVRNLRLENAALTHRVAERNAELEEANRQLQAANRELEAFTSTVSHDLRQPLNAMVGFADFLTSEKPGVLNAAQKEYLGDICAAGHRLFQLIDDLLRFSRAGRQELVRERVDVGALVASVVQELRATQDRADLDVRVAVLPRAVADPRLLRQVFVNLLANACKFTRDSHPAVVEIEGRWDSGDSTYSISDNGVGFDMSNAAKLFGVFQRLHAQEQFEGTGVGLSIVQRIVERHGGRISAEAQPGKGAKFVLRLPSPPL